MTRRVFKAAGVDHPRVGTRLLWHNAASRLLRAGTPLPTISAVLGHSSPDSTNVYLSTDTEHLRACVLLWWGRPFFGCSSRMCSSVALRFLH
ncbi:tyrosine-type recombinase/integrase [Arthrobacter sp. efr-133-TYG-118]|uniref:tyrosine-type recombinase/integrase n=1 Tax=Arthrobacter sp. efr-133-TYG-118 TaxID=3040279 RepID=UPI0033059907